MEIEGDDKKKKFIEQSRNSLKSYKFNCPGCKKELSTKLIIDHLFACKSSALYNRVLDTRTMTEMATILSNNAIFVTKYQKQSIRMEANIRFGFCRWCNRLMLQRRLTKHSKTCARSRSSARQMNRLDYAEIEYLKREKSKNGKLYASRSRYEKYPLSKKLSKLAEKIIEKSSTHRMDYSSAIVLQLSKGYDFYLDVLKRQPEIVNKDGNNVFSIKKDVDKIHQELLRSFDIDNLEMAFEFNRLIARRSSEMQAKFLDDNESSTSVRTISGGKTGLKR